MNRKAGPAATNLQSHHKICNMGIEFPRGIPLLIIGLLLGFMNMYAPKPKPIAVSESLWHGKQREMRYHPEGTDFVIQFAFALLMLRPIRIHLQTGKIVSGSDSKSSFSGKKIPGGAATVLDLPLHKNKTLKDLQLETLANDVVIGLMSLSLIR